MVRPKPDGRCGTEKETSIYRPAEGWLCGARVRRDSCITRLSAPGEVNRPRPCRSWHLKKAVSAQRRVRVLQPPLGAFEVSQMMKTLFSPGSVFHRDDSRSSLPCDSTTSHINYYTRTTRANASTLPAANDDRGGDRQLRSIHDTGQPTISLVPFQALITPSTQPRPAGLLQELIIFCNTTHIHRDWDDSP